MTDTTHEAATVVGGDHPAHESTGIDNRKLGMWVFLSSEFLFFGALITTYLLYSYRPGSTSTRPPSTTWDADVLLTGTTTTF